MATKPVGLPASRSPNAHDNDEDPITDAEHSIGTDATLKPFGRTDCATTLVALLGPALTMRKLNANC